MIKSIFPNTLTALNLFFGCIAVLAFLNHYYFLGITCVFVAALMDFFDGFVARALGVSGELGKQLDSLADMVSFGFVPGIIMYVALLKYYQLDSFEALLHHKNYQVFSAFLLTIFAALRLAIFTISTNQSTQFIGLPTPACTLFFLTYPILWLQEDVPVLIHKLFEGKMLFFWIVLMSYLMVSKLPLLSFKFTSFDVKNNWDKYLLILLILILSSWIGFMAIPFIILFYIVLSLKGLIQRK